MQLIDAVVHVPFEVETPEAVLAPGSEKPQEQELGRRIVLDHSGAPDVKHYVQLELKEPRRSVAVVGSSSKSRLGHGSPARQCTLDRAGVSAGQIVGRV